jgi:hypothetical protein
LEHYSDEPTQSYIKLPSKEAWLNGHLGATLSNSHLGLSPSGTLVVNIANVKTYPNLTEDFLWLAHSGVGFGISKPCGLR